MGYFNRPGPEIGYFYSEIAWSGSNLLNYTAEQQTGLPASYM